MILILDNRDSFVWNLARYFDLLGVETIVCPSHATDVPHLRGLAPEALVISPGPCTPDEAGCSLDAVRAFRGSVPVLGVCLGHQCLAEVYGARVVRANRLMHGKTSLISHSGQGVFAGLPDPFQATRYHSLIVPRETVPDCLQITAWVEDPGQSFEVMGLQHREYPVHGVQFHPESFLTENGYGLLRNFLAI